MLDTTTRKIPACQRCRTRKKKCDSLVPACSNCARANAECVNFDKVLGREFPRRALIQGHNISPDDVKDHVTDKNGAADRILPNSDTRINKKRKITSSVLLADSTPNHTEFSDDDGDFNGKNVSTSMFLAVLETANGIVDLEHSMHEYLVVTRGNREIFITNENRAIARLEKDMLRAYRCNIVRNKATDMSVYERVLLDRVFKRYFTWMNSAYPVLHETAAKNVLERCCSNGGGDLERFQCRMVVAIALALLNRLRLDNLEIGQVSRTFWKAAMSRFSRANAAAVPIGHLQNVLLVLQYALLVPESGNLWQLSGTAMRHATSMSLYTEPNPSQRFDPLTLDLRRRLFWTCYCIDRTLSTAMGRPSTVPDSWITAQLPALQEDKNITLGGISLGPACNLKVGMVLHVGICRLQSEIHARLYGPLLDKTQNDHKMWTWQMYDQLCIWRNSLVLPTPLIMREWADFQFHVSVVLLLRPLPHRPAPTHDELHVAFHSAGEAMKLARLMHRDHLAEFAWLTAQNLFMCGLTFIHALKALAASTRPMCLSFVDVVLQVQACTSMLETLAALNPGGDDKMRNVFEVASSETLHDVAKHLPSHRTMQGGCFWEVFARSYGTRMQRPVEIDGISVPIQKTASFAHPYSVDDPRLQDFDEDHFYHHDTDAGIPELQRREMRNETASDGMERRALSISSLTGLDFHLQLGLTLGLALEGMLRRYDSDSFFQSALAQHNLDINEVHDIYEMDGLNAILAVASEAEPLVALPDYSAHDLLAELDRWFLYPI